MPLCHKMPGIKALTEGAYYRMLPAMNARSGAVAGPKFFAAVGETHIE